MITTILTGAGAVSDWHAPETSKLTELLKDDQTFKTKSGVPIGAYLFCLLQEKNSDLINFEHIINLVESIYNYVIDESKRIHLAETVFTKWEEEAEHELFDFKDIYGQSKNGYFYPVPGEDKFRFSTKQNYIRQIYEHFIALIVEQITAYEKSAKTGEFTELNNLLKKFLNNFTNPGLRYYTTNYDRLPILISDFNPFEGFSKSKEKHHKGKCVFDAIKIGKNRKNSCYYNLHGSIHHNHMGNRIFNEFDKTFTIPNVFKKHKSQSGEELLRSSIITGMNKSSRILFSPHLPFYNSFNIDCMRSDLLIIIGYSFSDIHLNQTIAEAIKASSANDKFKILIIDYWKDTSQYDDLWKKMSELNLGFNEWGIYPRKINKADGNPHYIYGNGLKSFLKLDEYNQIFKLVQHGNEE